jgi:hypothetical protein
LAEWPDRTMRDGLTRSRKTPLSHFSEKCRAFEPESCCCTHWTADYPICLPDGSQNMIKLCLGVRGVHRSVDGIGSFSGLSGFLAHLNDPRSLVEQWLERQCHPQRRCLDDFLDQELADSIGCPIGVSKFEFREDAVGRPGKCLILQPPKKISCRSATNRQYVS